MLRKGPVARSPDALTRKRVLTPDLRAHTNGAMALIEMKTAWPALFNHVPRWA